MRKIAIFFVIAAGIMVTMMAGCGHAHKHEAHEHDENLQLTAYNDLFEVYAEVSPLVVNETAEVVAHFTWLRNFKPLETGTVTVTLTVGGKTVSQTMEKPAREGIYKFSITPSATGIGQLSFEIVSNDTQSVITVPNVTVYADAHEAQHAAADAKAASSNGVVFTKEMSWKVDFSTDSCRTMPFGQVIRTMAQVQPSQGDEYAITAKADGIVSINGELTEGKLVKAGQALFSIESGGLAEGNLDVRYQEAENNYLLAKAEYERKQALMQIVTVKGFGSSLGALCIALSLGEAFPMWRHLFILLMLGFVAYGLSIFFYTHAQRGIGAAKTSTYYALAPFIGAFLSVVILGEPIGWVFIVATLVMATGCWLAGR